ncbi:MAG: hypothetical protein NUV41_15630 [Eubacteriales bacterium]|jgi:hypothetical protein|nr:hypothetical protein [Eubacteriales bacterium]
MYRVLRASILFYDEHMKQTSRHELIRPFLLLVDTKRYQYAKEHKTADYLNLCDIISKMRSLYSTGEAKYHHFDMLLKELYILGFDISCVQPGNITHADVLKDQIDLLLQFLAFRYPFDRYDNRIGVHDIETGEFIFVQP